jgi:hypothetical protein
VEAAVVQVLAKMEWQTQAAAAVLSDMLVLVAQAAQE